MKPINYIIIGGVLIAFLATFIGGCKYGRATKRCPVITTTTASEIDTVVHHIYHIWPWYIQSEPDVVYYPVPQDVDTAEILKDYFAEHIYNRKWENDTMAVNVTDTIVRNTPTGSGFDYKLKIPFTTVNNSIDNSVTYNRYFLLGLDIPITAAKYYNVEAIYVTNKWYAGFGYEPEINSVRIKGGISILQFKHR